MQNEENYDINLMKRHKYKEEKIKKLKTGKMHETNQENIGKYIK